MHDWRIGSSSSPSSSIEIINRLKEDTNLQYILTTHSPNITSQADLKDIIVCKNNRVYALGKEYCTDGSSLLKKIVTLKIWQGDKEKELKTALVSSFKYQTNRTGLLEARFHPALKSYLLQIKNRFLLYDLKNILKISSTNSIRIYELLKSFEGIGKRTFEVEKLKQILDLENNILYTEVLKPEYSTRQR